MGLRPESFWGLSTREYNALKKQLEESRELQLRTVAAIRADLHNVAGKTFKEQFEPGDFMPGAKSSLEDRIYALIDQGYPPAMAAAMASSTQSREAKLHAIDSALGQAHRNKTKGRKRA